MSIWVHVGLKAIWVSSISLYQLCVHVGTNSEERRKTRPESRHAALNQYINTASVSGSGYYVVWLQVPSDLLAEDERQRKRATDREKENRVIPFKLKGRISSPHKQNTRITFFFFPLALDMVMRWAVLA